MHGRVGHEIAEFTGQQVLASAPGDAALRTRTGELWGSTDYHTPRAWCNTTDLSAIVPVHANLISVDRSKARPAGPADMFFFL